MAEKNPLGDAERYLIKTKRFDWTSLIATVLLILPIIVSSGAHLYILYTATQRLSHGAPYVLFKGVGRLFGDFIFILLSFVLVFLLLGGKINNLSKSFLIFLVLSASFGIFNADALSQLYLRRFDKPYMICFATKNEIIRRKYNFNPGHSFTLARNDLGCTAFTPYMKAMPKRQLQEFFDNLYGIKSF